MSIFSALLRLRQICCHPKLYDKEHVTGVMKSGKFEYLKGMLEQIIQEKHRVLLFSQFVDMLDIIKGWLEREGIPYEYLTGKTKDRQAAVENFNNNPNIPIFLISLKAGGTGLNLTGADYVIGGIQRLKIRQLIELIVSDKLKKYLYIDLSRRILLKKKFKRLRGENVTL